MDVVPDVADVLERPGVQVAQLLLRDVLAGRVHGSEVAGLRIALEVVRRHGEAVPVRAAADADSRAGDELRLEPGLVEPGRLDLTRLVCDPGGEDLQPAAPAARRRADDALDHGLLVAEEIADALRRHRLLVAPRPLPEEIAHRAQPELSEPARDGRTDAVERLDGRLEPIRSRRRPRPRPALGRTSTPREDRHWRAHARSDAIRITARCIRSPTRPLVRRRWPTCTASRAASGRSPRRSPRAACPRGCGRTPTSSPSGR